MYDGQQVGVTEELVSTSYIWVDIPMCDFIKDNIFYWLVMPNLPHRSSKRCPLNVKAWFDNLQAKEFVKLVINPTHNNV